jgi:alpha-1,2-mannosyltransferase
MLVPNGGDAEFHWGLGLSILGNSYVLFAALGIAGLAAREVRLARKVLVTAK